MTSILLRTPISAGTGYGHDGISLAIALSQAKYDVRLAPTVVTPPLPPEVAALFTKPLDLNFDYCIHHISPDQLGLKPAYHRAANFNIAWTMWEFLTTEDLANKGTLRRRLTDYDLLLSYDPVTAAALDPYVPKRPKVLHEQLQGGYWADDWNVHPNERDWSGTFRFGMVGQLHARKNPFVAIRAFDALKQEHGDAFDAELHLKTTIKTLHPMMEKRYPGLKIHYEFWSHKQMRAFYTQLHTLLAPSWGEGKNLPCLEAQTTGCPVIASDFGGHTVWAGEWSTMTPGTVGPSNLAKQMVHMEVDEAVLKQQMWEAYSDRAETKRKGELASRVIPAMCDWGKVVDRLTLTLERLRK